MYVEDGKILDRYQSLMNAGVWIPPMIEELTGIDNDMIADAPSAADVMREVAEFAEGLPLVAHNAAFDRRFWQAEMRRVRKPTSQEFVCSLLLSRRLFPKFKSHRLEVLAQRLELPGAGRYHRALADAQVTAHLLLRLRHELRERYGIEDITEDLLQEIQSLPKKQFERFLGSLGCVN